MTTLPAFPTSKLWALPGTDFEELAAQLQAFDPQSITTPNQPQQRQAFRRLGRTAIIEIFGRMVKVPNIFTLFFGGAITQDIKQQVNAAANDPGIDTIILYIDSPGGAVAGTADLADAVFRARRSKKVLAFIEDQGTSAGYFVASQAHRVVANRTALVGSIGVWGFLLDTSEAFKKRGVRAVVFSSGQFKATGAPGTKITDEQAAEIQRTVDRQHEQFVSTIERTRGGVIGDVNAISDGRVFVGNESLQLGLIDEVSTADEFFAPFAAAAQQHEQRLRRMGHAQQLLTELNQDVQRMMQNKNIDSARAEYLILRDDVDRHRAVNQAKRLLQDEGIKQ